MMWPGRNITKLTQTVDLAWTSKEIIGIIVTGGNHDGLHEFFLDFSNAFVHTAAIPEMI